MSNLKKFQGQAISFTESFNLKGGVFCEWYINQRTAAGKSISNGQMKQAMELNAILEEEGLDAAMAQGGAEFMARWA